MKSNFFKTALVLGLLSAIGPFAIQTLVVLRFIQGLGASAGMVIPRAVVRDLHTGHDAARLMSLLMLVFSVSPILAPLAGSLLIESVGWRSVFWAVTVAAILGLTLLATSLPETRPPEERLGSSVRSALSGYGVLLRDRHFLGLVFIGAFGISSFFAYLANSSFVMIDHYGLTPRQYSLAFAANAASIIGVSQLTGRLTGKFGLAPVVKVAVTAYAAIMLILLAVNLMGVDRLDVMLGLLFLGFGFLGLVIPTTAVLALDDHGPIAGTASALMGTLQFVTGAVIMAITGLFVDGTARPMLAGIACSSAVAFVLSWVTLGHIKATPRAAP